MFFFFFFVFVPPLLPPASTCGQVYVEGAAGTEGAEGAQGAKGAEVAAGCIECRAVQRREGWAVCEAGVQARTLGL